MTVSPDYLLISEKRFGADQFVGALFTFVVIRVM